MYYLNDLQILPDFTPLKIVLSSCQLMIFHTISFPSYDSIAIIRDLETKLSSNFLRNIINIKGQRATTEELILSGLC